MPGGHARPAPTRGGRTRMTPALYLGALLGGILLLTVSAERLVHGATVLARHLSVSPTLIGLTLVAFGTSAPEIIISALAAWDGRPGIAVGNVLGSNIANLGLILGIALALQPAPLDRRLLQREGPLLAAATLGSWALMADGMLHRIDGLVLLLGLAGMLYWILSHREENPHAVAEDPNPGSAVPGLARAALWVLIALAVLLASARMTIWGAVGIAELLGVSEWLIGLTVVAIGTSLPELATTVAAAFRRESGMALGNLVGSNLFNLLAVLGIAGTIQPLALTPMALGRDLPAMVLLTAIPLGMGYAFRHRELPRALGFLLLLIFAGYLAILIVTETAA